MPAEYVRAKQGYLAYAALKATLHASDLAGDSCHEVQVPSPHMSFCFQLAQHFHSSWVSFYPTVQIPRLCCANCPANSIVSWPLQERTQIHSHLHGLVYSLRLLLRSCRNVKEVFSIIITITVIGLCQALDYFFSTISPTSYKCSLRYENNSAPLTEEGTEAWRD